MTHWTLERRERQRRLIQQWKPWTRSTGPRTPEGKATSSQNSTVHGMRSRQVRDLRRSLRELNREFQVFEKNLEEKTNERTIDDLYQ